MDFFLAASRACAGWQQLQVECACKGDGIRHDSLLVLKLFASRSWSGLWSPRSLAGLITSNRKEAGEEAQWSNWSNGRSSPVVQQYISEDWSNGRKLVKRKEKPRGSSDNYTPHRQTFVMFGTWVRNCTTRYPFLPYHPPRSVGRRLAWAAGTCSGDVEFTVSKLEPEPQNNN